MTAVDAVAPARRWSVEGFRAFWAKPDFALIPRIREIATADIVGHWPRPIGKVVGPDAYLDVIAAIVTVIPDLSLTAPDYAQSGDLHFVRWVATGSSRSGRFDCTGVDRMRLTADGRVCEIYVCCDHPFFGEVAAYLHGRA